MNSLDTMLVTIAARVLTAAEDDVVLTIPFREGKRLVDFESQYAGPVAGRFYEDVKKAGGKLKKNETNFQITTEPSKLGRLYKLLVIRLQQDPELQKVLDWDNVSDSSESEDVGEPDAAKAKPPVPGQPTTPSKTKPLPGYDPFKGKEDSGLGRINFNPPSFAVPKVKNRSELAKIQIPFRSLSGGNEWKTNASKRLQDFFYDIAKSYGGRTDVEDYGFNIVVPEIAAREFLTEIKRIIKTYSTLLTKYINPNPDNIDVIDGDFPNPLKALSDRTEDFRLKNLQEGTPEDRHLREVNERKRKEQELSEFDPANMKGQITAVHIPFTSDEDGLDLWNSEENAARARVIEKIAKRHGTIEVDHTGLYIRVPELGFGDLQAELWRYLQSQSYALRPIINTDGITFDQVMPAKPRSEPDYVDPRVKDMKKVEDLPESFEDLDLPMEDVPLTMTFELEVEQVLKAMVNELNIDRTAGGTIKTVSESIESKFPHVAMMLSANYSIGGKLDILAGDIRKRINSNGFFRNLNTMILKQNVGGGRIMLKIGFDYDKLVEFVDNNATFGRTITSFEGRKRWNDSEKVFEVEFPSGGESAKAQNEVYGKFIKAIQKDPRLQMAIEPEIVKKDPNAGWTEKWD